MTKSLTNGRSGYIAITSAIILSLVLMLVAISLSQGNIFNRIYIVDFNNKQLSFSVARSCLNSAMLSLAQSSSYLGNEVIFVSAYTCTIRPIITSAPNKIVEVRAQIQKATTNLRLTVNSSTLSTVSLEELSSF